MSIAALIDRAARAREEHLLARGVTVAELHAAPRSAQLELSRIRGFGNERCVIQALRAAPLPNWIVSIRQGGVADERRGADLVFLCDDHLLYRLQIKSSRNGAERFAAEGRRRGRTSPIGLLVLADDMTADQIVDRVLGILQFLRACRAVEYG